VQQGQDSTSDGSIREGRRFLDQIYDEIHRDPLAVSHTMSNLLQGLHQVRGKLPSDEWRLFCKDVVPKHPLAEVIRQDPFTQHSVRKPRGYAGDAVLLDYIYGHRQTETTPLGSNIFEFTINTPASRAVRSRARTIASIIDRLAHQRGSVRVLSIACGHLREADMSEAVQRGQVAEYVAFDQDPESLAQVNERLGGRNVRTIQGSIGDLLLGRHKDLGGFDFVYAAGLYDYLSQKLATRMTSWMFEATRPGGLTLLTNYLRDIGGDGYMEAFMDWELIYRSPEELQETARRIPADQIVDRKVYPDEDGMVVFVELQKGSRVRLAEGVAFRPSPHKAAGLPDKQRTEEPIG
jgi:SAM-dependent methyltransferase